MNLILKQFKTPQGQENFPALFAVPTVDRIATMAANDYNRALVLVVAALTMAFESMNIKRGMNAIQIVDLSDYIVDSARDDNISFEDLVLFLQNLVTGKYELAYESMDLPKFMRIFQKYREERHQAMVEYRENEHLQYKGLGYTDRSNQTDPLSEHFSRLGGTLNTLRENMRELKRENNSLKEDK